MSSQLQPPNSTEYPEVVEETNIVLIIPNNQESKVVNIDVKNTPFKELLTILKDNKLFWSVSLDYVEGLPDQIDALTRFNDEKCRGISNAIYYIMEGSCDPLLVEILFKNQEFCEILSKAIYHTPKAAKFEERLKERIDSILKNPNIKNIRLAKTIYRVIQNHKSISDQSKAKLHELTLLDSTNRFTPFSNEQIDELDIEQLISYADAFSDYIYGGLWVSQSSNLEADAILKQVRDHFYRIDLTLRDKFSAFLDQGITSITELEMTSDLWSQVRAVRYNAENFGCKPLRLQEYSKSVEYLNFISELVRERESFIRDFTRLKIIIGKKLDRNEFSLYNGSRKYNERTEKIEETMKLEVVGDKIFEYNFIPVTELRTAVTNIQYGFNKFFNNMKDLDSVTQEDLECQRIIIEAMQDIIAIVNVLPDETGGNYRSEFGRVFPPTAVWYLNSIDSRINSIIIQNNHINGSLSDIQKAAIDLRNQIIAILKPTEF